MGLRRLGIDHLEHYVCVLIGNESMEAAALRRYGASSFGAFPRTALVTAESLCLDILEMTQLLTFISKIAGEDDAPDQRLKLTSLGSPPSLASYRSAGWDPTQERLLV
jgi:hypothetical protein